LTNKDDDDDDDDDDIQSKSPEGTQTCTQHIHNLTKYIITGWFLV